MTVKNSMLINELIEVETLTDEPSFLAKNEIKWDPFTVYDNTNEQEKKFDLMRLAKYGRSQHC